MSKWISFMMIVSAIGFGQIASAGTARIQNHDHRPGWIDLCHGDFWGQWSNGLGVAIRMNPRGWNQVDMWIENQGGYLFSGHGTCVQHDRYNASIDFTMEGYGAISYNHGQIRFDGYRIQMSGYQERSGLYFSLQR